MLSKKVVKDIQSLAHKKFRESQQLFVAEGPKTVNEIILQFPEQVITVYATPEWQHPVDGFDKVVAVTEADLQRISFLKSPHQVLALVRQFASHEPDPSGLILYLDAIQDPGNFGTIIRIADWFGVRHVVCPPGSADLYNPKVVQATMASISRVNVYYDNAYQWLQKQELPVFATTLDGVSIKEIGPVHSGIIIIGNESKGISMELMQRATKKITIPAIGAAESLNAAVATGIVLSHIT